jgi:hypothetical protein
MLARERRGGGNDRGGVLAVAAVLAVAWWQLAVVAIKLVDYHTEDAPWAAGRCP